MEIQNLDLREHRLRDLNVEINKLIREKGHWKTQIVELGGPNYTKVGAKMIDLEGKKVEVLNASGRGPSYRYFGVAKFLPSVKELFNKPPETKKRRSRYEIYKRIDTSFYGYRGDENGILEKVKHIAEEEMQSKTLREWQRIEDVNNETRRTIKNGEVIVVKSILFEEEEDIVEEEKQVTKNQQQKEREFIAHVLLPDEKEIERMVVEKKKQELLSKYTSENLLEEQAEAKLMLNVHQ